MAESQESGASRRIAELEDRVRALSAALDKKRQAAAKFKDRVRELREASELASLVDALAERREIGPLSAYFKRFGVKLSIEPPEASEAEESGSFDEIIALVQGLREAARQSGPFNERNPPPLANVKPLIGCFGELGIELWRPPELGSRSCSDSAFNRVADRIRSEGRTLLDKRRLNVLWQASRNVADLPGAVLEVGTYRGGTAAFLAAAFREHGQDGVEALHVVDTFSGHRAAEIGTEERQQAGEFGDVSADGVREYLSGYPEIRVHEGSILDVSEDLAEFRFRLIHLDVDLYAPTLHSLQFFAQRLPPGGVIVVDDYLAPKCEGVTSAVREFLDRAAGFEAWSFFTEQAVLVRRS